MLKAFNWIFLLGWNSACSRQKLKLAHSALCCAFMFEANWHSKGYPFPTYNKSAAENFQNHFAILLKTLVNSSIIIELRYKHCCNWRNCSSWAISYFATVFKNCWLQMRQNAKLLNKVENSVGKGEIACFHNLTSAEASKCMISVWGTGLMLCPWFPYSY